MHNSRLYLYTTLLLTLTLHTINASKEIENKKRKRSKVEWQDGEHTPTHKKSRIQPSLPYPFPGKGCQEIEYLALCLRDFRHNQKDVVKPFSQQIYPQR